MIVAKTFEKRFVFASAADFRSEIVERRQIKAKKRPILTEKSRSMIDKELSISRMPCFCAFAGLHSQAPTDFWGCLRRFL